MSQAPPDPSVEDVAGRVYRIEMRQASFDRFKAAVEVVAIIAAGTWAFYQFIYTDRIRPFLETPSLTDTITLQKLGSRGPWQVIQSTETIANDSKIRVSILAHTVNVYGVRVVDKPNETGFALHDGAWDENRTYRLGKAVLLQSHALLYTGDARSQNRRWWFEPDDKVVSNAIYLVPKNAYDIVRFDTNVQYTKYDVLPAFAAFTLPNGDRVLQPVNHCVDLDESSRCPITGESARAAVSMW